MVTSANSLDQDQAQQNFRPDLVLNCLTLMVFMKDFYEEVNLKLKKGGGGRQKKVKFHRM